MDPWLMRMDPWPTHSKEAGPQAYTLKELTSTSHLNERAGKQTLLEPPGNNKGPLSLLALCQALRPEDPPKPCLTSDPKINASVLSH